MTASGTTGCAHLIAGVQGKEQGCEASGGLSPMMLCPVVMDVPEESWAQDQNLGGEWSDMLLSMLEQDSQPNKVQPLAHCPTELLECTESLPCSFELFNSHMCCKSTGEQ